MLYSCSDLRAMMQFVYVLAMIPLLATSAAADKLPTPHQGAACQGSMALRGNLPLGGRNRSTEVSQVWQLLSPAPPHDLIGWVYQNRAGQQWVQLKKGTDMNAFSGFVSKLPSNARIELNGLTPLAFHALGKPGSRQQFAEAMTKRGLLKPCFSSALPEI